MSFRQFGGKTYSAKNNIISNHYSATNNLTITDNIGQSNSHINSLSDLDVCGNITASGNITANYMFLSSEYISTEDNAVMPKSYIDNIVTGKLNAGEGLNITTDVSGKSYINVDNSLNNIEYLDNNAGDLHLGEDTSGNIIIGKKYDEQTTIIQNKAIVWGGLDVSGQAYLTNFVNDNDASNQLVPKSYVDAIASLNVVETTVITSSGNITLNGTEKKVEFAIIGGGGGGSGGQGGENYVGVPPPQGAPRGDVGYKGGIGGACYYTIIAPTATNIPCVVGNGGVGGTGGIGADGLGGTGGTGGTSRITVNSLNIEAYGGEGGTSGAVGAGGGLLNGLYGANGGGTINSYGDGGIGGDGGAGGIYVNIDGSIIPPKDGDVGGTGANGCIIVTKYY